MMAAAFMTASRMARDVNSVRPNFAKTDSAKLACVDPERVASIDSIA
jgi:hypothetical protein